MNQIHNLQPVYNKDSRVLILGSFPSVISRQYAFYYHNPQNRFWKMLNAIYNEPVNTIDEKKELCLKHHIALWDVIKSCDIQGSSDASISNVVVNDITSIVKNSSVNLIITNGKTAHKYYVKYLYPILKVEDICMPSTSSANAQYKLDDLVNCYKKVL